MDDMHEDFCDFKSKEYSQPMPSVSYLIARVVRLMESDSVYASKRMQMVDGKHLSGDHSFKLTKCILSNGAKAFTAMYTLMNEFGQVCAWWFTTGSGMKELEDSLKKVKGRYKLHGFKGPVSFTTDRCCQERNFLNEVFELSQDESNLNVTDEAEAHDNVSDSEVVDVVALPTRPKTACTVDIADLLVGEISSYLHDKPNELLVIAINAKWRYGRLKADVVQICLMDGRTYVFHLAIICGNRNHIPRSLKMLLENQAIKKVGNRVHNDVKALLAWGVKVNSTIELGHVAHARALCSKAPALNFLIGLLWPGVVLDGLKMVLGRESVIGVNI